jgi:D-alanine-D-alanine ligase
VENPAAGKRANAQPVAKLRDHSPSHEFDACLHSEFSTMNILNPDSVILNGITLTLRYEVTEADQGRVREIVESTGFFHPSEVDVAVELVAERLRRGDASGYFFAFAERSGVAVAYVCYGPIPCTANSFDVYWIAVHCDEQQHGIGKWLMALTEDLIRQQNGRRIYVETSGRPDYLPTRRFYDRCGYMPVAELPEFYGDGDSKVICLKVL